MIKIVLTAISTLLLIQLASFAGEITGIVSTKGVRDSRNVVVFVKDVPGEFPPPEEHPVIDQKNLEFIPHVLPVVAGTTVDFLNSDNVLHNVFTPNKTYDRFNLGSWPQGDMRSYTFEAECEDVCAPVMLCNVHPEMEGFVVVLKNPYFAVTDKQGNFSIKDVPAGDYQIGLWHKKLKGEGCSVTVTESGTSSVELQMKR